VRLLGHDVEGRKDERGISTRTRASLVDMRLEVGDPLRRLTNEAAPDTLYGLDPFLREPPSVDALRPGTLRPGALRLFNKLRSVQRRSEDHPTDADAASATEELVTPD